jgi:hypothetical protein
MSFKGKIMNIVSAHPRLVTLGIGLAITFGIGLVSGIAETHQAHGFGLATFDAEARSFCDC